MKLCKDVRQVFCIGINDADYGVNPTINGRQVICPFYKKWVDMLKRCYYSKYQSEKQTYLGCTVCEEWLTFSNFKSWMETQNWSGKQLDKDLLLQGNKHYCPETCVFVDAMTNLFITDSRAARGDYPIGVCFSKREGKFMASCSNPFTKKRDYLGYFNCPDQAHEAWRKRKHELACQLADLQADERVAKVLRERFKDISLDKHLYNA